MEIQIPMVNYEKFRSDLKFKGITGCCLQRQICTEITVSETTISFNPRKYINMVSGAVKKKYIVDVGLLISFVACFFTGILKLPGFERFFHKASISLPMDQLSLIHDRSGVWLGVFVLIHLYLNRKWIASTTRKLLKRE